MKFPRNEKILRSPFEMAPFASVFFLLVIFVMLSVWLPTPGVPLQVPMASDLPGVDKPSVSVAVDAMGRIYYQNQVMNENELKAGLVAAVKKTPAALTLIIHADKSVTYDQLMRLTLLARGAGIQNALLATLPATTVSR